MDKFGRKRRTDPAQESIVAKKDQLNERTKRLIALLIETKRGWNGRPAPGIGIQERGDIKLPLPEQVMQAAKAINGQTDEILGLLEEVIREQGMYSQNRRKSQREVPLPEAPPTTAERAYELKKLATNGMIIEAGRLSRFLAHVKAPFQWDDEKRKTRLRALRFSAKIFHLTKDIENSALTGDSAAKLVFEIKNLYYLIKTNIIDIIIQDIKKTDMVFRPYSSLSTEYSERRRERERGNREQNKLLEPTDSTQDLLAEYEAMTVDVEKINKDQSASQIVQNLTVAFRAAQNKRDIEEMRRIHSELMSLYKNDKLQKNAHNTMSRWLRRQRMGFRETQDATLRLKIDEGMRQARASLENLMRVLEQPGDFSDASIEPLINICKALIPTFQATTVLAENHNNIAELDGKRRTKYISHSEILEIQNMSGILYEDMMELYGLRKPKELDG